MPYVHVMFGTHLNGTGVDELIKHMDRHGDFYIGG